MMKVYELVIAVVRKLGVVAREIERADADLARQLRRAATSVALNTAEGQHGRGRRKQASFSVALGEARECVACVHVSVALGYRSGHGDASLLDELDRIIATLYKLSR